MPPIIKPPVRLSYYPIPTADHKRNPWLLVSLLSLLFMVALLHFVAVTHLFAPTVQAQNCLDLVRTNNYTQTLKIHPETQQIKKVQLIDRVVGGQPAVLVQVEHSGPHHVLDVYVYGCTMSSHNMQTLSRPTLIQLFKQEGLIQGSANISQAHTLFLARQDTTLPPDIASLLPPLQQNIYQEYSWQHDTFRTVNFPALYPVTSRSEAEVLQKQSNRRHRFPWSDPLATAQQMGRDLLRWSDSNVISTLVSNNGKQARILMTEQNPYMEVMVTLTRLIQQDKTGLWFIVKAQTPGITLETIETNMPTTSSLTIHGKTILTDGQSSISLFDHTLMPLHILNDPLLNVQADETYTTHITYPHMLPDQSGLLLLQGIPPGDTTEQGQLLLTRVRLS